MAEFRPLSKVEVLVLAQDLNQERFNADRIDDEFWSQDYTGCITCVNASIVVHVYFERSAGDEDQRPIVRVEMSLSPDASGRTEFEMPLDALEGLIDLLEQANVEGLSCIDTGLGQD